MHNGHLDRGSAANEMALVPVARHLRQLPGNHHWTSRLT